MTWSLWSWLAPAVLLFWVVGAHNRLTRLRAAVLQAFAVLDGHLQAWIALAAPAPEEAATAVVPLPEVAAVTPATLPETLPVPTAVSPALPSPGDAVLLPAAPAPAVALLAGTPGVEPAPSALATLPAPPLPEQDDLISAPAMAAWAGLRAAALQLQACLLAARQRPLDRDGLAALSAARDVLRAAWRRLLADAPPVAGMPHAGGLHLLWDQGDTQVQLSCEQFNQAVLRYNTAQSQFPAVILAWILRLSPARTL